MIWLSRRTPPLRSSNLPVIYFRFLTPITRAELPPTASQQTRLAKPMRVFGEQTREPAPYSLTIEYSASLAIRSLRFGIRPELIGMTINSGMFVRTTAELREAVAIASA